MSRSLTALASLALLPLLAAAGFTSPGNITGLVAAVYSPFKAADLALNLDGAQIDAQAAYLAGSNVGVAFVCGTTGESVDLTVAERMALAEAWVEPCKRHGLKLMVHVGTDAVMDARALAAHAQKIGAWGIAAMPPTYIKPGTVESLVATMSYVAAGAPDLPFYYYHIPSMTGVSLKMRAFMQQVDATPGAIPNLNGIKFTDTDLTDLLACVRGTVHGRSMNMLYGVDGQLLSALVLGVHGAVGSTYNFNGAVESRVVEAFQHGDLAGAADAQADVVSFLGAVYGAVKGVNGGKALMNLIGAHGGGKNTTALDVGPPRLPQLPPSKDDMAAVRSAAVAWCTTQARVPAPWCGVI